MRVCFSFFSVTETRLKNLLCYSEQINVCPHLSAHTVYTEHYSPLEEKEHYTMILNTMPPSTVAQGAECVLDSGSKTYTFSLVAR